MIYFTGIKERNLFSDLPSYVTICAVPSTDEKYAQIHKYMTSIICLFYIFHAKNTYRKVGRNKDRIKDRILLKIAHFFHAGHFCNNAVVNKPATSEYGHFTFHIYIKT
jgi:hypothetical protein